MCMHGARGARGAQRTARTCASDSHTRNVCFQRWYNGLGLFLGVYSLSFGVCCLLAHVAFCTQCSVLITTVCTMYLQTPVNWFIQKRCTRRTVPPPEVRMNSFWESGEGRRLFFYKTQCFIGLCLRRTHDLSQSASANLLHQVRLDASSCARERLCDPQSIIIFVRAASANFGHQVRLDAISFARERLCDPQSIIIFVRASAPQCHRCRSHQASYGCEYPEELSRCFSAKGRGLLTCHTRTMERVIIRNALWLFCGAWPVQSPCLVFFCSMWSCLDAFGFVVLCVNP